MREVQASAEMTPTNGGDARKVYGSAATLSVMWIRETIWPLAKDGCQKSGNECPDAWIISGYLVSFFFLCSEKNCLA